MSRVLPRSRPLLNLLEIQLKEDDFQNQSKQISFFLTHPDVEGVYETNVPLMFRIISNLGCCAAVSRLTKMQNSHSTFGFGLKELEFRSTAQQKYLESSKFQMLKLDANPDADKIQRETVKYMYFYHSTANNSNTNNDIRSIFTFIYQMKREKHHHYHCRIIAVNPHKKHKLQTPQLQQQAQQLINHFQLDHYKNIKIKIKESSVKTIAKAYQECNKFLDEYKLLLNGPTVLLCQTAASLHNIYSKIPIISDNFPIIPFHFNELDNRYPALQWYKFATTEMIKNWLVIPNGLEQKKSFSRYSHIPIGNMPDDIWSYTRYVHSKQEQYKLINNILNFLHNNRCKFFELVCFLIFIINNRFSFLVLFDLQFLN